MGYGFADDGSHTERCRDELYGFGYDDHVGAIGLVFESNGELTRFNRGGAASMALMSVGRALDGAGCPDEAFDRLRGRLDDVIRADEALFESVGDTFDVVPDAEALAHARECSDAALGGAGFVPEPDTGREARDVATRCLCVRDLVVADALSMAADVVRETGTTDLAPAVATVLRCASSRAEYSADRAAYPDSTGVADAVAHDRASLHVSDLDCIEVQSLVMAEVDLVADGGLVHDAFAADLARCPSSLRRVPAAVAECESRLAACAEVVGNAGRCADYATWAHSAGRDVTHVTNLVSMPGAWQGDLRETLDAHLTDNPFGPSWKRGEGVAIGEFADFAFQLNAADACCGYVEGVVLRTGADDLRERAEAVRGLCDSSVAAVSSVRGGGFAEAAAMRLTSSAMSDGLAARSAGEVSAIGAKLGRELEGELATYGRTAPVYDGREGASAEAEMSL